MCRRNHLWGGCALCFGLGLLIAQCFESGLVCLLLGVGLVAAGLGCFRQR